MDHPTIMAAPGTSTSITDSREEGAQGNGRRARGVGSGEWGVGSKGVGE